MTIGYVDFLKQTLGKILLKQSRFAGMERCAGCCYAGEAGAGAGWHV